VVWGILAAVISLNLFEMIGLMTFCSPMEKYWDPTIQGTCLPIVMMWIPTGFHTATDVLVVFLPLPFIFTLTITARQKLGLLFLFTVGIL
jgi:hypothetical protein